MAQGTRTAYRSTDEELEMGPPAPDEVRVPGDWGDLLYFLPVAVALAFVAAGTVALSTRVGPIAWAIFAVAALAPLWPASLTIRGVLRGTVYRFDQDALHAPKRGLFGRPSELRYDRVTNIERKKYGLDVTMEGGQRVELRQSDHRSILAALELRVGHALDRKGLVREALARYESADCEFDPSLDARIAPLYEKTDDLGEALERRMGAVWEYERAFGSDDARTAFLRGRLEAFKRAHPDVELYRSWDEILEAKRARVERQPFEPPMMRDTWITTRREGQ